ncbi:MAG: ankyrin repeat domain-containing protein [Holosporales bacterium]|jgi:ankyrin repeat protein|nr:ankyrin repeat domain-containing protein [Holosporales bacterium]
MKNFYKTISKQKLGLGIGVGIILLASLGINNFSYGSEPVISLNANQENPLNLGGISENIEGRRSTVQAPESAGITALKFIGNSGISLLKAIWRNRRSLCLDSLISFGMIWLFSDSLIYYAVRDGYTLATRFLIYMGANVNNSRYVTINTRMMSFPINIPGIWGRIFGFSNNIQNTTTLLHLAAANGHLDTANVLLAAGAEVNATDENRRTPLHLAAENRHLDIVNALLPRDGINVNATDENGRIPLHSAAENGHLGIVNALLPRVGANVNTTDRNGRTPLHSAAENGHLDIVNALLPRDGINVNTTDGNGRTPLHSAAAGGHLDIVNALLPRVGANVNYPGNIAGGVTSVTSFFANIKDKDGATPLHLAVAGGHLGIATALLATGVNVNIEDKNGATPLRLAAAGGNLNLINALLNAPNVNIELDLLKSLMLYTDYNPKALEVLAKACGKELGLNDNEIMTILQSERAEEDENKFKEVLFKLFQEIFQKKHTYRTENGLTECQKFGDLLVVINRCLEGGIDTQKNNIGQNMAAALEKIMKIKIIEEGGVRKEFDDQGFLIFNTNYDSLSVFAKLVTSKKFTKITWKECAGMHQATSNGFFE